MEGDILGTIINEQQAARELKESGAMLFPEQESQMKQLLKTRRRHNRMAEPIKTQLTEEVKIAMDQFDPETANKKQIRAMRKMLQALSLEKYPKKKKAKKEKAKKSSKK